MDEGLTGQQRYLLDRLATTRRAALSVAEMKKAQEAAKLGLSEARTQEVLQDLTKEGWVEATGRGGYRITAAGKAVVTRRAPVRRPEDLSNQLLDCQKVFTAFQLLQADGRRMPRSKLNEKFKRQGGVRLELTPAAADYVLYRLVEEGYVTEARHAKSSVYALTDRGVRLVVQGKHYDSIRFAALLTGAQWTAFFAAVREAMGMKEEGRGAPTAGEARAETHGSVAELPAGEVHKPRGQPVPAPSPGEGASAAPRVRLEDAIMLELEALQRDQYAGDAMVPIHELRRRVAFRHQSAPPSHDAFDKALMGLRADDRVHLVAISDLSAPTPEQLADSVEGMNEIFFSARVAREHASVG